MRTDLASAKDPITRYRVVAAGTLFVLALSACSSSDSGSSPEPGPKSKSSSSSSDDSLSQAEMIERAEAAVKNSLPDAPIWKGMKFAGVVVDASTVCVDRTYRKGGGLDGKGGNAGYVLVTFPDEKLGEPTDGVCADVSGAPTEPTASPVEVPAGLQGEPGLVTRDDLGDEWPLTVDYGVLACRNITAGGMDLQVATFTTEEGTEYALNGTAKDHTDAADIEPIWASDPEVDGLKIDIGPLIDRALALC